MKGLLTFPLFSFPPSVPPLKRLWPHYETFSSNQGCEGLMVWDQHFEKGSSNHCTKMKGKVLPWPLFVDTAKAPEHFTELTFSAAKRRRANGMGAAGELWSGEGTGLWERRHQCSPKSVPCMRGWKLQSKQIAQQEKLKIHILILNI